MIGSEGSNICTVAPSEAAKLCKGNSTRLDHLQQAREMSKLLARRIIKEREKKMRTSIGVQQSSMSSTNQRHGPFQIRRGSSKRHQLMMDVTNMQKKRRGVPILSAFRHIVKVASPQSGTYISKHAHNAHREKRTSRILLRMELLCERKITFHIALHKKLSI